MENNEIINGYCKRELCPPAQEIIKLQKDEIDSLTMGNEILEKHIAQLSKELERANKKIEKQKAEIEKLRGEEQH
jgi:cell division protein FtsB